MMARYKTLKNQTFVIYLPEQLAERVRKHCEVMDEPLTRFFMRLASVELGLSQDIDTMSPSYKFMKLFQSYDIEKLGLLRYLSQLRAAWSSESLITVKETRTHITLSLDTKRLTSNEEIMKDVLLNPTMKKFYIRWEIGDRYTFMIPRVMVR